MNVRVLGPTTAPDALLYSASQRTAGVFLAVEKTQTDSPQDFPGNAACVMNWKVTFTICVSKHRIDIYHAHAIENLLLPKSDFL